MYFRNSKKTSSNVRAAITSSNLNKNKILIRRACFHSKFFTKRILFDAYNKRIKYLKNVQRIQIGISNHVIYIVY